MTLPPPSAVVSKATPPRVSIGMPVYQAALHIREAFDSLRAQSFTDFEVIISDNGSTDATEEICKEYVAKDRRFKYFRNPENLGAAANYNRVFELSTGEYFKWQAHDDLILPSYLERMVEILDREGERVSLAFSERRRMSFEGELESLAHHDQKGAPFNNISFARLVSLRGTHFPSIVFGLCRRATLAKTGLIGAYGGADMPLCAELRLRGEFRQVNEQLYIERLRQLGARKSYRGEAAWYDPRRGKKLLLFPRTRLFQEFHKAIERSPVSRAAKIKAMSEVFAGRAFVATETRLAPYHYRAHESWQRGTFWAADSVDKSTLPLRAWAFVSGLRRGTADPSLLASLKSWPEAQSILLGFAAERLARTEAPEAKEVLDSWKQGSCQERAEAARAALKAS